MTAPRNAPWVTQERLHALFYYDPEVGSFSRRVARGGLPVGAPVGVLHKNGYLSVKIDKQQYAAHRLAWLYVHGCWPAGMIDHINGNRADNRLHNLRECTNTENGQNRVATSRAYRGLTCVRVTSNGKFSSYIGCKGNKRHLGTFATPELAHAAYLAAKAKLHTFNPVPRRQHEQRSAP